MIQIYPCLVFLNLFRHGAHFQAKQESVSQITSHGVPDISAVVHGLRRTILLLGMGKNFQSSHTERLHKLLFTASLFGAQHKKNSVENKREILLAVPLDKTLNGMSPPLRRRQEVGPSSLSVVVAQSNWRPAKRANEKLIIWEASPNTAVVSCTSNLNIRETLGCRIKNSPHFLLTAWTASDISIRFWSCQWSQAGIFRFGV